MPFRPDRLKGIREAKGLTLKDLAALCGVHFSRIARYEAGPDQPTSRSLEALATALEVSTDYLLGRDDPGRDEAHLPPVRVAIVQSLAVFLRGPSVSDADARRLRRVAGHPAAPRSSAGWKALKEMMDLGERRTQAPRRHVKPLRRAAVRRKPARRR